MHDYIIPMSSYKEKALNVNINHSLFVTSILFKLKITIQALLKIIFIMIIPVKTVKKFAIPLFLYKFCSRQFIYLYPGKFFIRVI